ncbi:hypothetical protein [Streptomyces sp. NPDC012508]|uniref:hypothetical protein n=1 Tax=Streptomyces sp. NPDC012508 TaxID=3364837 RepID=UPI0036B60055
MLDARRRLALSSQKRRAQRGNVLAICKEWLTGSPSPADVRKWLDRAKTGGEPRSTGNSLLLEELRDHLAATDTDPAWRELAAHEVFGLRVYTYTGNMEIMTALAAVSGATVTAAILPFLQAIAAQAGQRSFEVARATTRRMIGRGADLAPDIHRGRTKVFVEGSAPSPVMLWTPEQTGEFLDFIADDRLAAMWHGFILRGPRRGEMCALPWSEVSLSGSWFRISAQTVEVAYRTYNEAAKQDSVRTVTLDAQTKALWIAWRETQQQEREQWSGEKAWVDSGRGWTHENGEALHPDWISRRFNRLVELSGLPPVCTTPDICPRHWRSSGRRGAVGND